MGLDSAANNKIMTKLLFSVFISGLLYFAVVVETPHQAVSLSVRMAVSLNSLKLHTSLCSTNSWILREGRGEGVQILF